MTIKSALAQLREILDEPHWDYGDVYRLRNILPSLLTYVEKLEAVAEAAKRVTPEQHYHKDAIAAEELNAALAALEVE